MAPGRIQTTKKATFPSFPSFPNSCLGTPPRVGRARNGSFAECVPKQEFGNEGGILTKPLACASGWYGS